MKYRKIAFIGAGNIANAIIAGIIKYGSYPSSMITVCSPTTIHRDKIQKEYGVVSINDNHTAVRESDVIILAIKPQIMKTVCELLQNSIDFDKKLILTTAVGISAKRYNDYFNYNISLIRIMPNILSLVGKGIVGLFSQPNVSEEDKSFVNELMKNIGLTIWCEYEEEINNIVAISGSSPAYVFLFMEAIQQKAQQLGYNAKISREITLAMVQGSIELSKFQKDMSFSALYKRIATNGGVTKIALDELNNRLFKESIIKSMQSVISAAKKMEELF
ncbi:Pyrroline-5-carboxylate reductase [Candidatus Providencia siddallii]|uniref:Pyrroline-5-carboxylate reductase n=1 Tax=Candidatus Providencia siddallii TaxID=1715285 RepID=A0A0M6W7N0_9GAMM|nr:Pyrroline-5-carboxylate reductase [Candidatus Providencia siddallii]